MKQKVDTSKRPKTLIKKCHSCGQIHESEVELQKCMKCGQAFLPLNYFSKVHSTRPADFLSHFANSHELHEDELIIGLYVLW